MYTDVLEDDNVAGQLDADEDEADQWAEKNPKLSPRLAKDVRCLIGQIL